MTQQALKIVEILNEEKRVPARELSERLYISMSTVSRYIEKLKLEGVPIESKEGKGSGYEIRLKKLNNYNIFKQEVV